jgi:hypothetical protein
MAHRARLHPRGSMSRRIKQRSCLRCDQTFLSEGSYNRLCQACREYLNAMPTPEDEHSLRDL